MNLSVAPPVIIGTGIGEQMIGDNFLGDAVDFFNPAENLSDAAELATDFFNWAMEPFIRAGEYISGKQKERSGCDF